MRRFSVRSLMAFIFACAIGLAALRNANDLWAGAMLFVALAAFAVAVLGAVILRGRERSCWLGFALFSGGYLTLTFGPGLSTEIRLPSGSTRSGSGVRPPRSHPGVSSHLESSLVEPN